MRGFIKGASSTKSNVFKVTTGNKGIMTFVPVKMVNLCYVQHDGQADSNKTYVFKNPTNVRLKPGTRVVVNTYHGDVPATVVDSIKVQRKYLKGLLKATIPHWNERLRPVVGVIEHELSEPEGQYSMSYKLITKWAEEQDANFVVA